MCALLRRHMYGTRMAGEEVAGRIQLPPHRAQICPGDGVPTSVQPPGQGHRRVCAQDDFTAVGPKPELDWFEKTLKSHTS